MALPLRRAISRFIEQSDYIVAVHDLITKWRLELSAGYILDCYFNETVGKYSYTLIKDNKRVMGWDNAAHHPQLPHFPHHFHTPDQKIVPSDFTGNPEQDLEQVRAVVESFLAEAES
jgi:hypothetical protein